ncbi:MAG: hypothetical protein Q9213_004019 [Squamulea squamosa]
MDRHDEFIERHVAELEQLANRASPPCPTAASRDFLGMVNWFRGTTPSRNPCGCGFANRVLAVHFRVRRFFNEATLEPLKDFVERQSEAMIESANLHIDQASLEQEARLIEEPERTEVNGITKVVKQREIAEPKDIEEGEIVQDNHEPITPISPSATSPITISLTPSPSLPFSVAIKSINTTHRYHVTKEGSPPFTLTFNHGTRHYDLIDEHHHPSYFLYTFHPLNLKIVAWAPGSLQVHTQTKDYVKKNGTGEYMSLTVETVDDLEKLVEELKVKGVEAWKMEL